jgi:ligand-binding sensor domain-containing protein
MVCRLLVLLLLLLSSSAIGQVRGRDWSPEDRVIVGDFTRITSVATSQDRVFATSPSALLIWNPQFRQWEGPISPPDPALLERVFTSLVDPLDNSLWLARVDGWVHYDPNIQLWDHGILPEGVQEMAFDLNAPVAGLHLRSGGNWYVIPRGGISAIPGSAPVRPLRPTSVQEAIRANPTLQSATAQVLLDNRLATARFTAAARSVDGLGWYMGTWGVGLLYLPEGGIVPQRLTYGLPGTLTSALFSAPGGVWVSTDRTNTATSALTYVAFDLSGFNWIQGDAGIGLPFSRVRRIIGLNNDLWLATDAGAARVNPDDGRVEMFDEGKGLSDNRVYSVAARRGVLVVGTARGLSTIRNGMVQRLAPEYVEPVYSMALSAGADTVWVGTPRGMRVAVEGEANLLLPTELNTVAALSEPVVAIGWHADTLVGLTEDRVIWRDSRLKSWWLGPTISSSIGRLRAFASGVGGLWVAAEKGVAFVPFNAMPARIFFAPTDIPGNPLDVAVDDDYLWVASDGGLTRFRLTAVRP